VEDHENLLMKKFQEVTNERRFQKVKVNRLNSLTSMERRPNSPQRKEMLRTFKSDEH
jgi:hypothetical protein